MQPEITGRMCGAPGSIPGSQINKHLNGLAPIPPLSPGLFSVHTDCTPGLYPSI